MKYVGKLPGRHIKNTVKMYRTLNPYLSKMGVYGKMLQDLASDAFYIVKPTEENVRVTLQSWEDRPPIKIEDKYLDFGFDFLDAYYKDPFRDCIASSEEISSYIDYTKAAGWPYSFFGYQSKAELVASEDFAHWISLQNPECVMSPEPYWNACPKKEYQATADIERNKIRLFQIPPYHLLYASLKFGKKVSLALRNYKWSAYGFNPYYGGVDKLAKKLASKKYRMYYDVSGWDKYLPILRALYVRFVGPASEFDKMSDEDKEHFAWMVTNTVGAKVKLPSGDVYEKLYGNPSGSGTTTRDNILGHILIIAYAMSKAYEKKFGTLPTLQQVCEQIAFLFGDDSVISVDEDFSEMVNEEFMREIFAEFGMKLKFFFGGENYPISQMTFLGFRFKERNGFYLPEWDVVRLATTFVHQGVDHNVRLAYIARAFVLTVMSWPTDHYKTFAGAYYNLIQYFQPMELEPEERAYIDGGVPTPDDCESLFIGFEGNKLPSHFSVFSEMTLDGRME